MRRYSSRHSVSTLSEINITPLLDLCFVLLVIFMITTPLLENSIDLVVPTSATARTPNDPSQVQTISIDKAEKIKLNNDVISIDNLEAALRDLLAQKPGLSVIIRPHRELAIQKFVNIMDVMQRLKIAKVGVLTQPEE